MNRIRTALAAGAAAMLLAGGASAAPILWDTADGGNGHYYELVTAGATWGGALANAATFSHMGSAGYLVTLTSAAESTFVRSNLTGNFFWAAGSDTEQEGVWKWMAGPEVGVVFWNNGATSEYNGWCCGEPNQAGDEDGLMANWSGIGWNDASTASGLQYVVEYNAPRTVGGIPEPSTWAMMILGFGAAGAVIRRREARAVTA